MQEANGGCGPGGHLRWQLLSGYMQESPVPQLAALLEEAALAGQLTEEDQTWVLEHCIRSPLDAYFPRSADYRR